MSRRTRQLFTITAAGRGRRHRGRWCPVRRRGEGEHHPHPAAKPDKVVIIVVDSLSKEIVDKYRMRNVQRLMKHGVDTPRSYVGHTGSVTVVTHNVITSGQLPKHMGWTDEGYRDVAGILGDPEPANPDQLYITSNAAPATCSSCSRPPATPSWPTTSVPQTRRPRPSRSAPRATPATRSVGPARTRSSRSAAAPECTTGGSWRKPSGENVPSYILGDAVQQVLGAQRLPGGPGGGHELRLRHHEAAGGALPARQRPLRDRARPGPPGWRRLGGRRGHRGHAQRGELERHLRDPARRRQGGAHVGRRDRPGSDRARRRRDDAPAPPRPRPPTRRSPRSWPSSRPRASSTTPSWC